MRARLRGPGGDLFLVGTVQGLASEAKVVLDVIEHARPVAVALGVSPETAASLLRLEPGGPLEIPDDIPDHDFVYGELLRQYGEVGLPPPDLVAAAHRAREMGAGLYGVDLSEEAYETTFTKTVSTWDFLKLGRVQRRLAKRPPRAPDAGAFCIAWDAGMRNVKGLARMEALREETIAKNAASLLERERGSIALVVELPRASGVKRALLAAGLSEA